MTKATVTRTRILEQALRVASLVGLEGLTLGHLASELDLSKSGLFAHFGSKERLQIEVLRLASESFVEKIVRPAIAEPRGAPRVEALFERWLAWSEAKDRPGGCVFVAASTELDDRSGPVRDLVEMTQRAWLDTLARACRVAQEEGHYRADVDADQFAFEFQGLLLAFHHQARLMKNPHAAERARRAFSDLVQRASAAASPPASLRPAGSRESSEKPS